MASKFFPLVNLSLILLLSLLISSSLAIDAPLHTPLSSDTICNSTPHPSYCKSVLHRKTANVYEFGHFSVQQSLVQSQNHLDLLEKYLQYRRPSLSPPAVQALEDCHFLASLNIDLLSQAFATVDKTSYVLPSSDADDVQTKLSAVLTNYQTCYDSLNSFTTVHNDLAVPLSNGTNLCSVALALFTKGWVPKGHKINGIPSQSNRHLNFRKGRLSLTMSNKARAVYDSFINRRRHLLEAEDEEVVVKYIAVVCQDGSGNFTTINDAIAAAPINSVASDGYFMIYITAGVYPEYVSISSKKKYLLMIGDGINRTIITGNHSVGDGWTTFNSPTFAVVAQGFVAVNITIRNTAGASKNQAVAVRNGADMSVFYSCSFEAYQDTLYTHSMRQFYRECDIYGTVDFIFGNAAVVFQNCNMYPRRPLQGQSNMVTAQGRTDINQNTGISIQNCTITAAADLGWSGYSVKSYLGRPWKEYSRTVVMQSFIDTLIDPAGWLAWNGDFALSTLYYAEYNNRGPGSDTSRRVTWPGYHVIYATDAASFTVSNFVLGNSWLPQTRVPYNGDLI